MIKCKENLIYSINKGMADLAAAKARLNTEKFQNSHFPQKGQQGLKMKFLIFLGVLPELKLEALSTNPAFFVFFVLERPGHFPYFSAFSSFLYLLVLIVGVPVRPLAHCAVLAEPGAHLRFETPSATGALLVLVSFCLFFFSSASPAAASQVFF